MAASIVDRPLFGYKLTGMVVGGLLLLLIGGGMVLLRNRQGREFQAAMTEHYRVAAEKVEAQRRFLDGINGALPDLIGVKTGRGAISMLIRQWWRHCISQNRRYWGRVIGNCSVGR